MIKSFLPRGCRPAAETLDVDLKPIATFPPEGHGAVPFEQKHPGGVAGNALGGMAAEHGMLAVLEEAAALGGSACLTVLDVVTGCNSDNIANRPHCCCFFVLPRFPAGR